MIVELFSVIASLQAAPVPMPDFKDARRAVVEADAQLFWAAFEGCDPLAVGNLVQPDFTMVHDQGGLAVASGEAFVANLERQCAARAPGGENEGYANRRLPVPGTRIIRPLGEWGMLEEGEHVFFERDADGAWQLIGGARYMHVWEWVGDEGKFRLKSAISYDHGAATPYPPQSAGE